LLANAASTGYNLVSGLVSSVYNTASQTAAHAVETTKQTANNATEGARQINNEAYASLNKNKGVTETEGSTSSSGGVLPLDEILKQNNSSPSVSAPVEEQKLAEPKKHMVYAVASDDGSEVKVLGRLPEGVGKEEIEAAMHPKST